MIWREREREREREVLDVNVNVNVALNFTLGLTIDFIEWNKRFGF